MLSVRDQYNLEKRLLVDCGVSATGVLLGLFTGMRIGELCGLKRKDFDFEARTVTVSRSVGRISDLDSNTAAKTKVTISTPKTNSGIRQIPLPEFLAERMKNYCQDIQNEHYILSKEETPMEPHQLYGRYKTLLKKAGIKGNYKFHTLRHTFATRCVEKGFDIKSLSEILGHANINITLSTYVHPSMEQKRSQMELLTPLYCEDAIV